MVMDKKEIFDRIEYVVACVGAFAQRFNLSNMQAYPPSHLPSSTTRNAAFIIRERSISSSFSNPK